MTIKIIPFDFVCHQYTQNAKKRYSNISTRYKHTQVSVFLTDLTEARKSQVCAKTTTVNPVLSKRSRDNPKSLA